MTSQYKYLIAIVVIVFGILAWWTIKPLSATADPKCASNAYLIKHFRFTKGVKDNDTSQVKWGPEVEAVSIPDVLPEWQRKLFANAMQLPIDAGDLQIEAIFPSPPKVGEFMGTKGFALVSRDNAEQHLSLEIQKYKGCLSQIRVFNFGLQTNILELKFLIPTGLIQSKKNRANSCQHKLDAQRFVYSVNSVAVATGKFAGVIPKPIEEAFSNWGAFNYNREYLFELVGRPMVHGSQYSWLLNDDKLGKVLVTEDVVQNCSKVLSVRWKQDGEQHELLKYSLYSEPPIISSDEYYEKK